MENPTLRRLLFLLIEPHHSIVGARKREQARFLSSILLVAIPIIAFTALTSDLLVNNQSIYLGLIILIVITYLGTRTKYYNVSFFVTIAGFTVLPLFIWFFATSWTIDDLPRMMTWIFVALIIGGLLTRPKIVIIQGTFIIFTMLVVVGGIFATPIQNFVLQ